MNKTFLRMLFVVAVVIAAIVAFSFRENFNIERVEEWVSAAGPWAWLLYVLTYALVSLTVVPVTIMTMTGGIVFGPVIGTVLALIGAALGASSAFLLSRHLLADWVRCRGWSWLNKLIDGVDLEGWRFVALVRLVPVVPFAPSNYGFGLTSIPLPQFLAASLICMAPATFGYSWLGYASRAAIDDGADRVQLGLVAFAVIGMMVLIPQMVRRMRRKKDGLEL